MDKIKIIVFSVLAAGFYGVIHDQITIRLCPEYFTVAHPPIFHTSSLTLLAFYWGVAATAGIGAIVGYLLAVVSQEGVAVPLSLAQLLPPVSRLLIAMSLSALIAGITGYWLSRLGWVAMPAFLSLAIPAIRQDRFMAAWFAHGASYVVGLSGSAILCYRLWVVRGRPRVIAVYPRKRNAIVRVILLALIILFILWAKHQTYW